MPTKTYKLGSLCQDSETGIKALYAGNTAGAKYSTLGTGAGGSYQVPVGKKLYLSLAGFFCAAANGTVIFGYGDTVVADSVVAPVNAVEVSNRLSSPTAFIWNELNVFLEIPAGKYPFFFSDSGGSSSMVYGLEV